MSYQKFRADHLFTGDNWLNDNYVLITSEQGQVVEIVPAADAGDDIAFFPGILSPGFVNCHCHLELSHMKGMIPEGTGMVDFLIKVIQGRQFGTDLIAQAIASAEQEMLDNGIVAVGDICNTADTVAQKKLGRLQYHNFIEAIGFVEATAPQRFEAAHGVYEQFARLYRDPAGSNSIVPHAPYSVSPKLFQLIGQFPANRLISVHYQESEAENEFMRTGGGDFLRLFDALRIDASGVRAGALWPYFLPNQLLMLVHNAVTKAADLQAINRPVIFCLCPNANLYIGNPLPDIQLLRQHKAQIVLGTDSLASNHQLSILSELQTIRNHWPDVPVVELLQWATINGAKALQLDSLLGSFEPGKEPGVLLIDQSFSAVQKII
jgi:aminodeoxyfutalosine deaminase